MILPAVDHSYFHFVNIFLQYNVMMWLASVFVLGRSDGQCEHDNVFACAETEARFGKFTF